MKKLLKTIKQDLLGKVFGERRFRPSIRAKQLLILSGTAFVFVLAVGVYISSSSSNETTVPVKEKASDPKEVSKMTTPLKPVDDRDIWVSRIEKKAEEVKEESQELRQENRFLQKRIDVLEELFKTRDPDSLRSGSDPQEAGSVVVDNETQRAPGSNPNPFPDPQALKAKPYPPQGSLDPEGDSVEDHPKLSKPKAPHSFEEMQPSSQKKRGAKIAHIGGTTSLSYKTKDLYMPAGTYSKAVVVSGLAASTATNAQGNPQPMMLRLVDDGNLPRGFKGRVKDAVLIGSCYGDISSERAYCRLETLSWVEAEGTTVEKKVEGWVFGEDGRAGLRGEVVDRSTDIARESFGAGLLSAAANFFKMESSRSVYPVSPFGQSNAMSSKEALQGAGASGVGSALDRLAEFSIKRAEQMQPVIVIASGRVVDIAFKEGVSLTAEDQSDLKTVNSQKENTEGEE